MSWPSREVPLGSAIERLAAPEPEPEGPEPPRGPRRMTWEDVEPLLPRIDPLEADMVRMKWEWGMTQSQIGAYFGVGQVAVSYRLARATQKFRLLLWALPSEERLAVLADWAEASGLPHARTLRLFLANWSATRTAEAVGATQGQVRPAVIRCLEEIARSSAEEGTRRSRRRGRDAERVLRAIRDRWCSRLSGARTFEAGICEPLLMTSSDRDVSPAVLDVLVAMVEEWESARG